MTDTANTAEPRRRNLIPLAEVERRTGLTSVQIARAMREDRFPKSIRVTRRATLWVEEEIDAYVEALIKGRDRGDAA